MVRTRALLLLSALGAVACRARLPVEHVPATHAPLLAPDEDGPVAALPRVEYYQISDG
jgi:hypothetical protein